METEYVERVVPFQLQFDKPVPSQIKIAEWNPEKDLLAMVTEDSKILLHRFNWQRLWTVSPGKCVTSLCWRPDGKAIAVGLEDGSISLHNVENGKLLRSMKSHNVAVVCLNWVEEDENRTDDHGAALLVQPGNVHFLPYEDRTFRFFPLAPRAPRVPGVVSGDTSFMDDNEDSFQEILSSSHQRFNILCSADKDGNVCFSIFGIFPIGKINIHQFAAAVQLEDEQKTCQILNASICKVALSKDLCRLVTTFVGTCSVEKVESGHLNSSADKLMGFHCMVLDTSIFQRRRNELHQVAQQASNIENLTEVVKTSISVMHKQWCDAIHTFHEKFNSLSTLIVNHGMDSSAQEEFLSLLGGARTSPSVHQFLVNSLGESGLKRVSKAVCSTGKELQLILLDHLQPAAEMIGFRIGELRGLSRWRSRYGCIGLDETLVHNATDRVGMLLVQIGRFLKILSSVVQQFTNFFSWLQKCIKMLMSEPTDQLPSYSSELVVIFLKFLYDQDPVGLLLEQSEVEHYVELDLATLQRVEELGKLGGFLDTKSMQRTLAKEFQYMELSLKETFSMPYTTISKKIVCQHVLPLCPFRSAPNAPTSISFYKDSLEDDSTYQTCHQKLTDYVSFKIPDGSFPDVRNCIGILRGSVNHISNVKKGYASLEALILSIPDGFECVDLSLYKECQVVMILNEIKADSDSGGNAHMMIVQASELPFASLDSCMNFWKLHGLKDSVLPLRMEDEKVRSIPHRVVTPLAVSASRGVACVYAAKRRALVYILDEDEEDSDLD